jgi:hypothetical protein
MHFNARRRRGSKKFFAGSCATSQAEVCAAIQEAFEVGFVDGGFAGGYVV